MDSALLTAITATATQISGSVSDILPVALPVAGGILAVGVGWKIFRRFVKA